MSLHTQYRPKKFSQVLGQDPIVASLSKALERKTSQTFLLHGPSGTGKTTLARIAALVLGCKRTINVNAAKKTGVEDMRDLTDTLGYKPFSGENVVFIVDECHMLSKSAWNSLLEATEEPPEWAYWFFCTTELGKVPANIKTRCTTYGLKPVDEEKLMGLLDSIISKERLSISPNIRKICVVEAQGSPRQAIVNLEACLEAKNVDEAKELLQSAHESPQAIDLARLLMKKAKWHEITELLREMRDQNPESIRHVVREYMTSVALNKPDPRIIEILDEFCTPFNSGDKISPVLVACAKVVLQ